MLLTFIPWEHDELQLDLHFKDMEFKLILTIDWLTWDSLQIKSPHIESDRKLIAVFKM